MVRIDSMADSIQGIKPMSYAIADTAIFQDRRLSGADARLLLAILSHTRPNKPYCWPSRARLAELIGIKSQSRVSEILSRLVGYGWISIKRTGRSSLYTVHAPCPTSDVHTCLDIEVISERFEESPPFPPLDWSDTQDATQPLESAPAPEQHQDAVEAAQSRLERIAAAQRLVTQLNRITGLQLPLDASGIAVRRAARALNSYTEQEIQAVILAFALGFHRPASLLKSSILEPLIAEQRRRDRDALERARRDRETIEAMRQPTGTRTKEGTQRGLAMLREAVGLKTKPNGDGQMRA